MGQTIRTTTTWPSSSRAWGPPTGWTTIGQEATGRTTLCLSSSKCSTPTVRRGRPLTASTLETDSLRSLPSRSTTWDMQQYTMPSPWFGQKYEQMLDTCYEMATNLPAEIADNSVVSGSFGTVKLGEI